MSKKGAGISDATGSVASPQTTTGSGGELPQVQDSPSVQLARELDAATADYVDADKRHAQGAEVVAQLRAARDAARAKMTSIRNRLSATASNAIAQTTAARTGADGIMGTIPSHNGGSSLPKGST